MGGLLALLTLKLLNLLHPDALKQDMKIKAEACVCTHVCMLLHICMYSYMSVGWNFIALAESFTYKANATLKCSYTCL